MDVSILTAGNWGTVLALILEKEGHQIKLWEPIPSRANRMNKTRENTDFLPGHEIPRRITISSDIRKCLLNPEVVILAHPSHLAGQFAVAARDRLKSAKAVVSMMKGLDKTSLRRMSEVLRDELPEDVGEKVVVVSGPTIANEVAKGLPTSAVVAGPEPLAELVQKTLATDRFRVYTSQDVVGVELGGALKNVVAIAAGICDGLSLGANAKGALLTRGLAEIARLGIAMGAEPMTFAGLSGMGDLITTCTSEHSRNRFVGEQIGKGRNLQQVLDKMLMVAEGVNTTQCARELAKKHSVEMPITEQIYQVLFESKSPLEATKDLMTREPKPEFWE
jgi:glycerol-3-phosphate dehydrogenase (NAD(P)+)